MPRKGEVMKVWCVFHGMEYDSHDLAAIYDNEAAALEDNAAREKTIYKSAGQYIDVEEREVESTFSGL